MSNLRQAAEMALEALEALQGGYTYSKDGTVDSVTVWCPKVITALRAALAEEALQRLTDVSQKIEAALAKPQRKPLTEEEIGKAWSVADGEHNASAAVKRRITRAIEHAHGIKGEA